MYFLKEVILGIDSSFLLGLMSSSEQFTMSEILRLFIASEYVKINFIHTPYFYWQPGTTQFIFKG